MRLRARFYFLAFAALIFAPFCAPARTFRADRLDRQDHAAHGCVARRPASALLCGVDRPPRTRHALRQLQAVPHGEGSLFEGMGRRTDAQFHLLHAHRPCHPWQLRGQETGNRGFGRLRAAGAGKCREALAPGEGRRAEQRQGRGARRGAAARLARIDGAAQSPPRRRRDRARRIWPRVARPG